MYPIFSLLFIKLWEIMISCSVKKWQAQYVDPVFLEIIKAKEIYCCIRPVYWHNIIFGNLGLFN